MYRSIRKNITLTIANCYKLQKDHSRSSEPLLPLEVPTVLQVLFTMFCERYFCFGNPWTSLWIWWIKKKAHSIGSPQSGKFWDCSVEGYRANKHLTKWNYSDTFNSSIAGVDVKSWIEKVKPIDAITEAFCGQFRGPLVPWRAPYSTDRGVFQYPVLHDMLPVQWACLYLEENRMV